MTAAARYVERDDATRCPERHRDPCPELLEQVLGEVPASRAGRLEAIEALIESQVARARRRANGLGKSLVYFLATRLLREAGQGPRC